MSTHIFGDTSSGGSGSGGSGSSCSCSTGRNGDGAADGNCVATPVPVSASLAVISASSASSASSVTAAPVVSSVRSVTVVGATALPVPVVVTPPAVVSTTSTIRTTTGTTTTMNYHHNHHHHHHHHHHCSPSVVPQRQLPPPSPLTQPPHCHYSIVTLQRSTPHIPWGLTVTFRNGRILIEDVISHHHQQLFVAPSTSSSSSSSLCDQSPPSSSSSILPSSIPPPSTSQDSFLVGVSEYYTTYSGVSPTHFIHTHRSEMTTTFPQDPQPYGFRQHLHPVQQPPFHHCRYTNTNSTNNRNENNNYSTNNASCGSPSPQPLLPVHTVIQSGDWIVQIIPPSRDNIATKSSPHTTNHHAVHHCNNQNHSLPLYQQWDSLPSFLRTLKTATTRVQLVLYRQQQQQQTATVAHGCNRPLSLSSMILPSASSSSVSTKRQLFDTGATSTTSASGVLPVVLPAVKKFKSAKPLPPKTRIMNYLFHHLVSGEHGILFDEDDDTDTTIEGRIVSSYYDHDPFVLPPVPANITAWIYERKQHWRQHYYRVYQFKDTLDSSVLCDNTHNNPRRKRPCSSGDAEQQCEESDSSDRASIDFWTAQGYTSWDHWYRTRKAQWSKSYSWNQQKRQVLEQDLFGCPDVELLPLTHHNKTNSGSVVSTIPVKTWNRWLRIRKTQWKVWRRKRQRCRSDELTTNKANGSRKNKEESASQISVHSTVSPIIPVVHNAELIVIDAILEEQEKKERAMRNEGRPPLDIAFLFDSTVGCPDDIVAKILLYLPSLEHFKFLCISQSTRHQIKQRHEMWKQLLPAHWTIPRRPRKSWHELYAANLRMETEQTRKYWDDLLSKASTILQHGDQLQAIEKLVNEAPCGSRRGRHKPAKGYDINYASGVVCERNSILNLAVIHQRQKVVRWLVEVKHADIESMDRGNFTPLLNAAWAGNKALVRFLMQKGADRSKIGRFHYTKPVAPIEFEGLTAEGWAEKKGHCEVSRLLRLGL